MEFITRSDEDRFWARVEKTNHCWYWLRYKRWSCRKIMERATHYGIFKLGDKSYSAHKLAYILTYGDVPDGLVVRHRCGNSGCVNPEHLIIGTQSENMQDLWFHRANPGMLVSVELEVA